MVMRLMSMLIFTSFIAVVSFAQSSASFGPQIGFYKATDADQSMGMGGIAMRLKLSDGIGLEGSINYRKEKYYNGSVSVNSWPVMVTGLLYVVPIAYGALGAGWYNTSVDYTFPNGGTIVSETSQEFGWHFGGGLELPLGSSAKLIGDLRYVFLDYDFSSFPGSNGVNSNFYVMSVGLLFVL